MYVFMYVCMYVCSLNCTQPRNPALSSESFYATRIDPPKGGSMILVTKTSDQTRQRGHTLSTCNNMFARSGTDYEIRNQWFFAILEAMTTD